MQYRWANEKGDMALLTMSSSTGISNNSSFDTWFSTKISRA
jgi:hypothetical protein